ncbi:NAD-dependent epimerase/dehydratase family protein [Natrialba aegyptia]|uniref:UDP-glucose 4-epimerase n=1 Tax=Natrialba aegyptia DSM 13077 TaxID=1227491 RepID=M0AGS7_9EURY|nr:NAD(P)-dependent oxidoreductase [Natrialba aegyptia]ELY97769.1 UDP-glucose 4-epimerase [Natrialba aegyptia DSM 13077]
MTRDESDRTAAENTSSAQPVRVAITGAAGYIGSRIVAQLQSERPDWELTALDNFYRGSLREIGSVTVEHVDVRNRDRLWDALQGADIVMHLAAISGIEDCKGHPELAYDVNVTGTGHVARFCRRTNAGLIFPTSMAVVGDPQEFPITADHPRDPLNWYGRTKVIGERLIDELAADSFPAHHLLKSNLYGTHAVDGRVVTKATVLNFFAERALENESLPVYEPGTQSRNFVHVKDVARAYIHSADVLLEDLAEGATGIETFPIASDEDPSVLDIAETVREKAAAQAEFDASIELTENPRGNETLVDDFPVETTRAHEVLGWDPIETVDETIRSLIETNAR